jgi:hypothetical protein
MRRAIPNTSDPGGVAARCDPSGVGQFVMGPRFRGWRGLRPLTPG